MHFGKNAGWERGDAIGPGLDFYKCPSKVAVHDANRLNADEETTSPQGLNCHKLNS